MMAKGFSVKIAPEDTSQAPPPEVMLIRDGLKRLGMWDVPLRVSQSSDGLWLKFEESIDG
jgi:hypothetical protein